jgi:hypothetical protein
MVVGSETGPVQPNKINVISITENSDKRTDFISGISREKMKTCRSGQVGGYKLA